MAERHSARGALLLQPDRGAPRGGRGAHRPGRRESGRSDRRGPVFSYEDGANGLPGPEQRRGSFTLAIDHEKLWVVSRRDARMRKPRSAGVSGTAEVIALVNRWPGPPVIFSLI